MSAVWARHVLDDPETVLVVLLDVRREDLVVRVEDVRGAVILDQRLAAADIPELTYDPEMDAQHNLPAWASEPAAQGVVGRRRLLLVDHGADERFARVLKLASGDVFSRVSLLPREGDAVRNRYRIWSGESEPPHGTNRYYRMFGPEHVRSPLTPRRRGKDFSEPTADKVVAEMRAMLSAMAATPLDEDELAEAERYLRAEFMPVNSSLIRYSRALHAADLMRVFGRKD
ncbi:hypothetical protein B0293_01010 [Amycolatopsis azurea DSM 43854]|uniref:Uncharacterized protein n=1 Tax=Amycolatopsis azurea DSM 43854 TaxID=1238180 RepID=A0ABX3JMD0_9PSEU|nr:hypothetical protein B0293_01010 [Amycolatopsis azurea DSM 43854]